MMNCSEARRILWSAEGLRAGDSEVEVALAHAEECPVCSAFLVQDKRVAQLIRDSVPRAEAPRELRERLYMALERERAELLQEMSRLAYGSGGPSPVTW